ncbi:MAG: formylglycine-generating enzyme family protein, partial [Planctomycetota bacterium]|jgi:formylglycine-generating enzyme required for sulfatase activity
VTHVSAEDAEAYCAWLGKKTGLQVRLPREEEWEIAAGFDGEALRTFPWGNEFDKEAANLSGGKPKKVKSCPKDKSPSGAFDMAGNVCEWARAKDGGYVIRGGCFDDDNSPRAARVAFRQVMPAGLRMKRLGFRVAVEMK